MKHLEKLEDYYADPEYMVCILANMKYGAIIEVVENKYKSLYAIDNIHISKIHIECALISNMRSDLFIFKLDNSEIGRHIIIQNI